MLFKENGGAGGGMVAGSSSVAVGRKISAHEMGVHGTRQRNALSEQSQSTSVDLDRNPKKKRSLYVYHTVFLIFETKTKEDREDIAETVVPSYYFE